MKVIPEKVTNTPYCKSPLDGIWRGMWKRRYNEDHDHYKYYGGRGVTICDEWRDFWVFHGDMIGGYVVGLQIDRIENSNPYCKANCRWRTPKEQARNRTNNRRITFEGKTLCVTEWAEELNIPRNTLKNRMRLYGDYEAIKVSKEKPGIWKVFKRQAKVLKPCVVEKIIFRYLEGESQSSICKDFDVSRENISRIMVGATWKNVLPELTRPIRHLNIPTTGS